MVKAHIIVKMRGLRLVVAVTAAALPLASSHGGHAHMHRHEHAHHHETHDEDVEWSHDHDDHEDHAGTTHDGKALELSAANFDRHVVQDTHVWVVKFYSAMCGSCKEFAPEWDRAVGAVPCRRNPPLPKLPQVPCVGDGLHWGQLNIDEKENVPIAERYGVLSAGIPSVYVFNAMQWRGDEPHLGEGNVEVEPRGFWQRPVNLLNAHLMALTPWEALQDHGPPEPGSPATKLTAELVVENVEAFLPAPALPEIYPEIWIDASGYLTSQPPPHIDDDDAYEDGTAHDEYEAAMATEL